MAFHSSQLLIISKNCFESIFLADCEALKELLRNEHLRKYLTDIDTSTNAWNAMKHAMTEPLFIEFADECLKIVESPEATQ